jgi:surface antigen
MIYTPADLEPNTVPFVGAAALFNYSGVHHIAVVTSINEGTFSIIESNYSSCKITKRDVSYFDPALRGFWKP